MSSETTRKAVPQFPFPPKELYEPFRDSSYVQEPPRPPDSDEEYVIFGVPRKIRGVLLPSLDSQGHETLFESTEKKTEAIKRLVFCCLKRYMNILDSLSTEKPEWSTIEEELRLVEEQFVNIYHLLNLLRLDQAKWRMCNLFKAQISRKEELVEKLKNSRTSSLLSLKADTQDLASSVDWEKNLNSFLSRPATAEKASEKENVSSEKYWDMRETINSIVNEEKNDL